MKSFSPNPGFDELTTYGNDVYLTLDLDIQYLLDQAIQQVFEIQGPDYSVGLIIDVATGEVLAATTYPFFDLNNASSIPESQKTSKALISSIFRPNLRISEVKTLLSVQPHGKSDASVNYTVNNDYTRDLDVIAQKLRMSDGNSSLVSIIPDEEPKYVIFIGSVNPRFYDTVPFVLDSAMTLIEQGLAAQNKI